MLNLVQLPFVAAHFPFQIAQHIPPAVHACLSGVVAVTNREPCCFDLPDDPAVVQLDVC